MRPATTQKLFRALILLCCILPNLLSAQYYIDASNNLPDDDTSLQTKDVLTADIDGDGDTDVILANEFQNNVVLVNDGTGVFTRGGSGIPFNEEHDSEAITIADFNGDGMLDLIFVSEDDFEHEYYWNAGAASFSQPPLFLPLSSCRAILSEDFNGDNIPDIMLGNNGQNMMLINNGAGDFINETFDRIPFVEDLTQDLASKDLDGDGDKDIFVANEEGNRLLLNDGAGNFLDASDRLPQGLNIDSRTVLLEDVDMDGDADIFLSNVAFSDGKDAKNRLYLNDGLGNFNDMTEAYLPAYTDQSLDATFTDFDFDGDPDLIIANILGIPMYAYTNDGTGKFLETTTAIFGTTISIEAFGIVHADFNGDGFEDLYVCNRGGKDLLLLRDPTVLSNYKLETLEAKLYPNPVQSNFVIEGDFGNEDWAFQLLNLDGKLIQSFQNPSGGDTAKTFDLPDHLANGVYLLRAQSAHQLGTFRLLVMRK